MSIRNRLAKLEKKQRQILRCPWCQYFLEPPVPRLFEDQQSVTEDNLPTKCWSCGTSYEVPLGGFDRYGREVLDLLVNSHPTKWLVDERLNAARFWVALRDSQKDEYEKLEQKDNENSQLTPRGQAASYPQSRGTLTRKQERAKREREELRVRALEFDRTRIEHFKSLTTGPVSFPLDSQLKEIEKESFVTQVKEEVELESLGFEKYSQQASELQSRLGVCNSYLLKLKQREACEMVVWGYALPNTLAEIGFFEQEKRKEIDSAIELKREQDAEKQAELERLEAQDMERARLAKEREAESERRLREAQEQNAPPPIFLTLDRDLNANENVVSQQRLTQRRYRTAEDVRRARNEQIRKMRAGADSLGRVRYFRPPA